VFDTKVWDAAIKYLHTAGKLATKALKDKPLKAFTKETYKHLNDALELGIIDYEIPETLLRNLQKDVYLFSGFKTYSALKTASELLLTTDGKRKPYNDFKADVLAINDTYNVRYLEAEYYYAVGSAQMAAKWSSFSDNDNYYLQYRTAGDERVRQSHAALRNITLPKSDPFWDKYYAPNGWRCRCTVVEVLKDKYQISNSTEASKLGAAATTQLDKDGNNVLEIFRFNAGKEKVIFPPKHPYKVGISKNKLQAGMERYDVLQQLTQLLPYAA
jgi:SPP1 gp7 family putative phage head morphogenesis protein